MDWLRTRTDAWGQQVLEGANLELVGWFALAGVVLIVAHMIVAFWLRRRGRSGR